MQWRLIAAALDLSPREDQIVRHIFGSNSERGIALDLGISHHTVHTHVKRLYRKLHVSDRAGVMARILSAFLSLESRRTMDAADVRLSERGGSRALSPMKVTPEQGTCRPVPSA